MEDRSFRQHSVLLSDTVPGNFDLSCGGLESFSILVWEESSALNGQDLVTELSSTLSDVFVQLCENVEILF